MGAILSLGDRGIVLTNPKRSSAKNARHTRPKVTRVCPFCRTLVSRTKKNKHADWYTKHVAGCSRRPKGVTLLPDWVRLPCEGCKTCEVHIHTKWLNPLILCKSCREKRREASRVEREKGREAGRVERGEGP